MPDHNPIIGSWVLVSSEIASLAKGDEVYHFRQCGRFDMHYPNGIGGSGITKYFYEYTNGIIRFGIQRNLRGRMEASFEEDTLIILASHGMESYLERLSVENTPDWLDTFRMPPNT